MAIELGLSEYLNKNLSSVKKQLGGACKHLSFSKEKSYNSDTQKVEEYYAFYATMENDFGGRDKVVYRIEKPLEQLAPEDFQRLMFNLNSRAYEQGAGDRETVQ